MPKRDVDFERTMSRRQINRWLLAGGAGLGLAGAMPLASLAAQATPAATAATTEKVTLATGFMANVQFSPYYLAKDRGYYDVAGVDLTIRNGSSPDLLQQLGSGGVDFAITGGDALVTARAAGVPVLSVMAQFQKYPVGALAITGKGPALHEPEDLKGKKIGVSAPNGTTYIGLLALLQAANLTKDDVQIISIGFTEGEALQQGRVDAAMAFLTNEPVQLKALGIQVETLAVADFVHLASTGLATSDDAVAKKPELVQRFVNASLRGLNEALADPDAAFAAALKRLPEIASDKKQVAIQRDVLTATLAFMQPPQGQPAGWSDPAAWQTTEEVLSAIGITHKRIDPRSCYTNRFTEAGAGAGTPRS